MGIRDGTGLGERFALEGAAVVVADIDADGAAETVERIAAAGGRATAAHVDASDVSALDGLLAFVETTYGGLDVLFCHVGGGSARGALDFSPDDFDRTFAVNLRGSVFACTKAVPLLARRAGPSIILTASVAATHGSGPVLYSISKAALVHYAKALAVRLGPAGIRANAILPGPIDTPALRRFLDPAAASPARATLRDNSNIPLRRIGQPEQVASVALFLASDDASFVTGVALPVDGGLSVTS